MWSNGAVSLAAIFVDTNANISIAEMKNEKLVGFEGLSEDEGDDMDDGAMDDMGDGIDLGA